MNNYDPLKRKRVLICVAQGKAPYQEQSAAAELIKGR